MRMSALLHDIGHYPLSHLGESVYCYIKDNKNSKKFLEGVSTEDSYYKIKKHHSKSVHHETLGKYIVCNNEDIKIFYYQTIWTQKLFMN